MQIIAVESKDVLLVRVKKNELANVMGYDSVYGVKDEKAFDVGTEIKVHEIYDAIHRIKSTKAKVLKLIEELGELAMATKGLAMMKPFDEAEEE